MSLFWIRIPVVFMEISLEIRSLLETWTGKIALRRLRDFTRGKAEGYNREKGIALMSS